MRNPYHSDLSHTQFNDADRARDAVRDLLDDTKWRDYNAQSYLLRKSHERGVREAIRILWLFGVVLSAASLYGMLALAGVF